MSISRRDPAEHPFHRLRDQLPSLGFDPSIDIQASSQAFLKDYLQYYQLEFSPDLCRGHFTGVMPAAGYSIVVHYWLPTIQPAKGTVFVLHGYYDHVGLFNHLIRFVLEQGYVVVAYDQPGHGLSSGDPAAINHFSEYASVLHECVNRATKLPSPCFAVGQSTGGAVLLHALLVERMKRTFKAVVLMAPLIKPTAWKKGMWLYRVLKHVVRRVPRSYAENSHDQKFLEFIHRDPLQSRYLSVAWVGAMKEWLEEFPCLMPTSASGLVIQGEDDRTVAWKENLSLIQRKIQGFDYRVVPNARHHLVNESESIRQEIFTHIQRFLLASS